MSLIRGVLLVGKFRSHHELNNMSHDDQRNTLIVEMVGHSNQKVGSYQALNDNDLAGVAAVMVFLREGRLRDDAALRTMSADDQRNTLIVEIGAQTGMGRELQGFSNMDLVLIGLGKNPHPGGSLDGRQVSSIRGVLLAGKFRSQHDLNEMSAEDQRNTLIVELAGHSKQFISDYQAMNDADLAGAGAAMVFLREGRLRDDAALKTMTADDQRNTLIVEVDGNTHLGSRLQGLKTMDIVLAGMGVDPVFPRTSPRPYMFFVNSVEILNQKSDNDHSDSDWLWYIISVVNPITKDMKTFQTQPINIERNIKTGNIIAGNFLSDSFIALDTDIVYVTCIVVNLGSSRLEDQGKEVVQISNHIFGIVAPIAGTVIGFFWFGLPEEGFKVGVKIAETVDSALKGLSDVFDFIGWHFGPPNCNGEVLNFMLEYKPGELARAVNQPASKEITGPQAQERCGSEARSKVNFSVVHQPAFGSFGNK